jgi:hypothetical protein
MKNARASYYWRRIGADNIETVLIHSLASIRKGNPYTFFPGKTFKEKKQVSCRGREEQIIDMLK